MAIAFVNVAGTANGTPGTSLTISVPTGAGNGTFMLASVVTAGSDAEVAFGAPAGWTQLVRHDSGASANALQANVYYRIANNEPANYTWTIGGTGTQNGGSIAVFSGVDAVSAIDASAIKTGAGATISSSAMTTTSANDWILWDVMLVSNSFSAYVTPTGYISRWTLDGAGAMNCQLATKVRATSGVEATAAITTDMTAGDPYGLITIALKANAPNAPSIIPGYQPTQNRRDAQRRTRKPRIFCAFTCKDGAPLVLLPTIIQPSTALPTKRKRRSRIGWFDIPRPDDVASSGGGGGGGTGGSTGPTSSGVPIGASTSLPPPTSSDNSQWQRQTQAWMTQANQGHLDNTGEVTLAANANTTVVLDDRVGVTSHIGLSPLTADASAEIGTGTIYISSTGTGTFTLTHANNAQTDRTFSYSILG